MSEGGEILGIYPKSPVVIFYGDSITEGVRGFEDSGNPVAFSATHAYPWFCAKELGVIPYYCAYGSSGVVKDGTLKNLLVAIDNMTVNEKVPDDFQPDGIVINHGFNDSAWGSSVFRPALKDALTRLKEKYPNAPIVYAIPYAQIHASDIRKVGEELGVPVIETKKWASGIKYNADNVHPNAEGAKYIGEMLADDIIDLGVFEFLNK